MRAKRIKRLVIGVALLLAMLVYFNRPAFAHDAAVSGVTSCSNGNHVITWTITNDFSLNMTITSATAHIGATPYAVTGYGVVGPTGSTTAQSVVPGAVSGTIIINIATQWTDGFEDTASNSVLLIGPCQDATTTTTTTTTVLPTSTTTTIPIGSTTTSTTPTTVSTSTTTVPLSSTTLPQPTTTTSTVAVLPTSTVPSEPTTSTTAWPPTHGPPAVPMTPTPSSPDLPFTGVDVFLLLLIALCAWVVGSTLVLLARRRREP